MTKRLFTRLIGMATLMAAVPASAHEIWIERDGAASSVRIFLGEPAEPMPAGGDPEFDKLKQPTLLVEGKPYAAAFTRKTGYLEAQVAGTSDVRAHDDSVFAPWDNGSGGKDAAVFHARAGRSETRAALDFEIVPTAAGADSFSLLFKGKPVGDTNVRLINPDGWSKSFKSDAHGKLTIPAQWTGRYLLAASHVEKGPTTLAGAEVANLHHVTTLTFVK